MEAGFDPTMANLPVRAKCSKCLTVHDVTDECARMLRDRVGGGQDVVYAIRCPSCHDTTAWVKGAHVSRKARRVLRRVQEAIDAKLSAERMAQAKARRVRRRQARRAVKQIVRSNRITQHLNSPDLGGTP